MRQYHIERDGSQYGPYSADQIIEMLQSNQLSLSDHCWHEGMSGWASLSSVFNLAEPAEPPPLPAKAPTTASATYFYSTFGDRMGAYMLDAILFNIVMWTLLIAAGMVIDSIFGMNDSIWTMMLLSSVVCLWLYYAFFESSNMQGTPGKKACRLVVCDIDGRRISFWKATGRYFGKFISLITFGIGFLMCSYTKKRQCLHDILAGCQVVKKSK
jgi:uncharacterized RDD family membrane protein YckC